MNANQLTNRDYSQYMLSTDNKEVQRHFEKTYVEHTFKHYLALKVPADDIIKFFHKAQITGADPLRDQIFLIPRNTKVKEGGQDKWVTVGTIVFSYHFVEFKAQSSGQYEGYTVETGPDDYFDPISGESKKMLRSRAIVKRNGREYPYIAWWDEYVQTNQYGVTLQWKTKPHLMLEKCGKAGALRAAFPEWLSGAYTQEEMGAIEKDDEAIEATFKQQKEVEKVAEIQDRIDQKLQSNEQVDQIDGVIESIRKEMETLTDGATVVTKGLAMHEYLGVSRFPDLRAKPLTDLKLMLDKLKVVNAEKLERISPPSNLKNTSFKLE